MKKENTIKLVTSGVLISLAMILSAIPIFRLPFGGTITLFSMLPIFILSYKYEVKWGLICALTYSILQSVLDAATTSSFTSVPEGLWYYMILVLILDYLIAFSCLGFAGVFKNKIKNPALSLSLGAAFAGLLRLLAHIISGVVVWGSYSEWWFSLDDGTFGSAAPEFSQSVLSNFSGYGLATIYSIMYNSFFMIPEIILAVIGAIILINVPPLKKELLK